MRKIPLSDLAEHGLAYEQISENNATVTLAELDPSGVPIVVPCELQGEEIWLFPERASAHRKLLAALGRPFEES